MRPHPVQLVPILRQRSRPAAFHRRNVERKTVAVELDIVARKPHHGLIQAVKRAILLPGAVALRLNLNAKFGAARFQRSQPDSIHARRLFSGREWLIAAKHERHFRALRPASVERGSIGGDRAVPPAADTGNFKGQRSLRQAEVGAYQAVGALIDAVQRPLHRSAADLQVQLEMKRAEHARIVAAKLRRLRDGSSDRHKYGQPT